MARGRSMLRRHVLRTQVSRLDFYIPFMTYEPQPCPKYLPSSFLVKTMLNDLLCLFRLSISRRNVQLSPMKHVHSYLTTSA